MSKPARRVLFTVVLALVAASSGCVDDLGQVQEDLRQPLAAAPESVELGAFRRGATATARIELTNRGADEIIIGNVEIYPPDPCLPPGPCFPPAPCHIELIAPCVRPGESTTLTVSCTSTVAGTIDLTSAVDYRTASGASFQLTVPIHGTVR